MVSKSPERAVLVYKLFPGHTSLLPPLNWLLTEAAFRCTRFTTFWEKT